MALDGIMFEGVSVRVRRPNDYNPAAGMVFHLFLLARSIFPPALQHVNGG